MKVLLLNGSPHQNGCTYTALSHIASVLEAEGIGAEIVWIGPKPIRGCFACGGCSGTEKCLFDDDIVNDIADKAIAADGLIIGSPVYYAGMNGTLSSLLDRLFFSAGKHFHYKPAAAVVSARRAGTTTALDEIEKYFTISEMPVVSSSYWTMVHGAKPEDVEKDREGLQVMENLARNMAWMLRCIEAGRNAGILPPENTYTERTNFIR